jgi:hypothetical protein
MPETGRLRRGEAYEAAKNAQAAALRGDARDGAIRIGIDRM